MGRGREPLVRCESCGRLIPRDKAVEYTKGMSFDLGEQNDVVMDLTRRKVYYCISCAKHRKIFEKKKKQLMERRKRYE